MTCEWSKIQGTEILVSCIKEGDKYIDPNCHCEACLCIPWPITNKCPFCQGILEKENADH